MGAAPGIGMVTQLLVALSAFLLLVEAEDLIRPPSHPFSISLSEKNTLNSKRLFLSRMGPEAGRVLSNGILSLILIPACCSCSSNILGYPESLGRIVGASRRKACVESIDEVPEVTIDG